MCSFTVWKDSPVLGALISISDSDRVLVLFWEDPKTISAGYGCKSIGDPTEELGPFKVRSDHPSAEWPLTMDLIFFTFTLAPGQLPSSMLRHLSFPVLSLVPGPPDWFSMPGDLLPSLHDPALAKPLLLLTQLQHLPLLRMIILFKGDTQFSLNSDSSVVILSNRKHCDLESLQNSHT